MGSAIANCPYLLLIFLVCATRAAVASGVPNGGAAVAPAVQLTLGAVPSDLYAIHGSFMASAAPAAVWKVLSDYQGLAGIVGGLKSSKVLERVGGRILVEQVMEGHFLFFGRTLSLRLWITERPPFLIEFTNAEKTPFRTYQGEWRISPLPSGSRVDYTLHVSRGELAPRFLEAGMFQGNSEGLLRDLRRGIERRAGPGGKK
jgi:Polyketide cyclase / dehydrase and lipid transport